MMNYEIQIPSNAEKPFIGVLHVDVFISLSLERKKFFLKNFFFQSSLSYTCFLIAISLYCSFFFFFGWFSV